MYFKDYVILLHIYYCDDGWWKRPYYCIIIYFVWKCVVFSSSLVCLASRSFPAPNNFSISFFTQQPTMVLGTGTWDGPFNKESNVFQLFNLNRSQYFIDTVYKHKPFESGRGHGDGVSCDLSYFWFIWYKKRTAYCIIVIVVCVTSLYY